MKTLLQHLDQEQIKSSAEQRLILGKRIANIFDCHRMGIHIKVEEKGYNVMNYTDEFLNKKGVAKTIIKFFTR